MTAAPAPAAEAPRTSGLLVASLAISGMTLLLPGAMGPVGPFVAGVLAFLGHRRVRASGGALRGPRIALAAMTLALGLLVLQSWVMVRTAPVAAAWARIRGQIGRVDACLRTGTAEGAWDLLDPAARGALDRAAFVRDLRAAMERLGPLESLGTAREEGGDWEATPAFREGERAELRLGMAIPARFRGGEGVVRLEVLVRREGRVVEGVLTRLAVAPGP
ncbi:MAG: hypothetical protein L6R43_00455 [Planctomycetes bacterium]|nr:hypothetical protein [Planctomycetota bacterium]